MIKLNRLNKVNRKCRPLSSSPEEKEMSLHYFPCFSIDYLVFVINFYELNAFINVFLMRAAQWLATCARVRLLAICRGELSAAFARLLT